MSVLFVAISLGLVGCGVGRWVGWGGNNVRVCVHQTWHAHLLYPLCSHVRVLRISARHLVGTTGRVGTRMNGELLTDYSCDDYAILYNKLYCGKFLCLQNSGLRYKHIFDMLCMEL